MEKAAVCAAKNCNLATNVCKACAKQSKSIKDKKGQPALICKLCKTTELMEDFSDELPEDYEPPQMKLVYSAARDGKNLANQGNKQGLVQIGTKDELPIA